MKSIQGRLIFAIVLACIASLAATGLLLYRGIRVDLVRQFDHSLQVQAQAVSALVSLEPDGRIDFEYNSASMPEYQRAQHPEYFIIRFADGRVFAESKTLHAHAARLELPTGKDEQDHLLPTGRMGRAVRVRFVPQRDPDAKLPPGEKWSDARAGEMNIIVARDRATLTGALNRILWMFVAAGSALAIAIAAAVIAVVRLSMRPLRAVSDRAAEIKPTRLDLRLPEQGLPSELVPICRGLNDLLARLDEAFARERRFTSDVAHELRTPIAELRAIVDVALRWPQDQGATEHALREARQIAVQMQTLVQTLLDLVRATRATRAVSPVALEPIPLRDAVERALRAASDSPRARTGQVEIDIPDDAAVLGEKALLASVLGNVLSNAIEYGDPNEPVRCRAEQRERRWLLSIENRAQQLTADDLPHLREPFWRKDSARTVSAHAGLGLSLVEAFCNLMDVRTSAQLHPPNTFIFQFHFLIAPVHAPIPEHVPVPPALSAQH